jgi:ribonuclease HII
MTNRFDRDLIPTSPDLTYELPLWKHGWCAAGLDEAGRGAWAGPVMAAAVILPMDEDTCIRLAGVRDSKQVKPAERSRLARIIQSETTWAIGSASNLEIDEIGIVAATRLAMIRALHTLSRAPQSLLIDALFLPDVVLPQVALVKGDQRSLSIAAASILAKTARDAWMCETAEEFNRYGFERHKGYGTKFHQDSLANHGPCTLHRRSFQPIKELVEIKTQE